MRVIGTAGHVDHGKSTLIAALTGAHPDRLKEEQVREMTIELGFGFLTLPNGEEVGIIDVPGHRDFIANMLAGIGGIDAALLVIAADEGIMPQTKEHLAILDLLQISTGVIALTKIDLVDDAGWLDLLETDIRAVVGKSALKDAPIVRVSAKTRAGLEALTANLQTLLETKPARPDLSRPRLPIDRIFTMSGFGTVVTGTLSDGTLSVGDEVEILPSQIKGRIRGLQTHKKKEGLAAPGSRVAVNLSGIETTSIRRGNWLALPDQYAPSRRLDARFRLLGDDALTLKQNDEVKFFLGASETIATVRLVDAEELTPGAQGWIQLELRAPVVAVRGDHYILRRPSPSETLGGGIIVDPRPKGRHRRFDGVVLKSLESLTQGSPAEVLLEAANALEIAPVKEIVARSRLAVADAESALGEALSAHSLILLEEGTPNLSSDLLAISQQRWQMIKNKTLQIVSDFHKAFRLRRGIPREELKSKLKLSSRTFHAILVQFIARGVVQEANHCISLPDHEVRFTATEQATIEKLRQNFDANPFAPPSVKDCQAAVGAEVLSALIEMGELFFVSADVIFRKSDYDAIKAIIQQTIERLERISLAETRDLLKTSRKYAQALLEHFDAIGFTLRDGDFRRLK
ncbi:MAG: selenocysteine-specific translation elongation factor [Anaerolineae bacterium UTCFX1]|jgi:selenocysteine-specific elongation factor|nr:MAG: selenocysteine-specific translation elongation factor [Anaerolineae bacterium UTCFX1]